MINIKHKIKIILLAVCIAALFPISSARGTIASITTTPANPTLMSNGLSYYLAGTTYNFKVQVIDPDLTGWGQMGIVQIRIPNSTNIVLQITPSGTGAGLPVTIVSGTVNATADVSGSYNNCIVTFNVTIRWDTEELLTPALNTIRGQATTTYPAANTSIDDAFTNYGVCASIKILNPAADGVASDGMINRYHDDFNITGTAVYNITGATTAASDLVSDMTVATTILLNGVNTLITSATVPNLSFAIPHGTVATLGNNVFRVRGVMSTAGGPESSANTLTVNCDEVEITGMTFVNGGGINAPAYYRSTSIPGTEIVVTARMRNSLSAMVGNTILTINNYIDGTTFTVLIPNGSTTGTAAVPFPTLAGLPANPGILQNFYRVESITGNAYCGDVMVGLPAIDPLTPSTGQTFSSRINQPAAISIYWDNGAYPWYSSTPFTTWGSISATAYSLTFNWTGLALAAPNQDFYSYRIYYRQNLTTVFQVIDKTTIGFAALGTTATNTATITGLIPLTNYDYYITAIDVFGNEVPLAQSLPGTPLVGINLAGTLASTITVTISDGITTHENNSFTVSPAIDNPAARPLRKSAIKAKVFIVAAGDLPDVVNLLVANTATANLIVGGVINPGLTIDTPAGYYRIPTLKTGANEWTGFIPDTNPLIAVGTNVKFIIETIKGGVSSFADNDSETETPATADPNNYPFTFAVTYQPTFTPWPTRILNNVINDSNPKAYPAYYLTDDAYVTIKVYDIKGRVVKTLLDNAFRRGGQNIKEDGWQGDNKSRNKVGIGLYYIHFKADRASDGKNILNSFQKVVMAK